MMEMMGRLHIRTHQIDCEPGYSNELALPVATMEKPDVIPS